jgi:serpin B
MDRVLLPGPHPDQTLTALAALKATFDEAAAQSAEAAEKTKKVFGSDLYQPMQLTLANRLFNAVETPLSAGYCELAQSRWKAAPGTFSFTGDPRAALTPVNEWVAQQTARRIPEPVPADGIGAETRLLLVNTLHFKASWSPVFNPSYTRPHAFFIDGRNPADVPTMWKFHRTAYFKEEGYSAIQLPLFGCGLHFLVILPDARDGLAAVEKNLKPADLVKLRVPAGPDKKVMVRLRLPKFSLRPPVLSLAGPLKSLGMKVAFDDPPGSADFSRMVDKAAGSVPLAGVYHRAFLAIDEFGIEAAAATFDEFKGVDEFPKEIIFHVDHPFLFAIQDPKTGLCLFIGRVTDPR